MMGAEQNEMVTREHTLYNDNEKKRKNNINQNIINGGFSINLDSQVSNLTALNLSSQHLKKIPTEILTLEALIDVDLSNNDLTELPDSFVNLRKIRILNLSDNNLSKIPNVLYKGLHLIKTLNLSKNALVTFQKAPCCLALLQHLDLSCNRLVTPPPWLLNDAPASLDLLDLSGNPCFQLCPSCPESSEYLRLLTKVCNKVRRLKLNCCGFRNGVSERYLSNFSNVTHLDISNSSRAFLKRDNQNFISDLSSLPESIVELSAYDVSLACLPKGIINLPKLRYLDISQNTIQWFPPTIRDLKSLVILRAESSGIFLLPPEMNELPNLKELYLSYNELSSTDGFEDLVSLEVLDLYGNQYITTPNLNNLARLRALDLAQNYIEEPKLITLGKRVCSYEDLKVCLRSKYLSKKGRFDGPKAFPLIDDDPCTESAHSVSDFEDYLDAEDGDQSSSVLNQSSEEDSHYITRGAEVWDIYSDENFDPNDMHNLPVYHKSTNSSAMLTGELPYEVTLHPHYYTPFRDVSPVVLPNHDLPPPVEGQFDD